MEYEWIILIDLILGWLADRLLGDPIWLPHPVVMFVRHIHPNEHYTTSTLPVASLLYVGL